MSEIIAVGEVIDKIEDALLIVGQPRRALLPGEIDVGTDVAHAEFAGVVAIDRDRMKAERWSAGQLLAA